MTTKQSIVSSVRALKTVHNVIVLRRFVVVMEVKYNLSLRILKDIKVKFVLMHGSKFL